MQPVTGFAGVIGATTALPLGAILDAVRRSDAFLQAGEPDRVLLIPQWGKAMTRIGFAACLFLMGASGAAADEVQLVCEGDATEVSGGGVVLNGDNDGNATTAVRYRERTQQVSRKIRFDEDAGTFFYLGAPDLKDSEDGQAWVPAHEVEFTGDKIFASFKVKDGKRALGLLADVGSFGMTRIKGGRKDIVRGELNRITGSWSAQDQFNRPTYSIPCFKADEIERKF